MLNHKFLYFANHATFLKNVDNIPKESITFIQQSNCIYAYGQYFYCNSEGVSEALKNFVTKEDFEALQNKVQSPLNYKGSVQEIGNLPTDANIGDVYNVISTDMNYAWTGTTWDQFGSSAVEIVNDLKTGGSTVALSAEQGKILDEKISTIINNKQDKGNYVEYIDSNGRKVIQFNNNDIIGSVANTEDLEDKIDTTGWISLIHLNKWNVVDIGSNKTITNINTPKGQRPTVQEAGQSGKDANKIAYLSDVESLQSEVTNLSDWYVNEE